MRQTVSHTLSDDAGGLFTYADGVVSVASSQALDYEAASSHSTVAKIIRMAVFL